MACLDGAGNWSQFSDKVDGSTDVDTRSDTSFNEYYEALGETITHDDNGNMSEDGTYEYEWDVFNRLRRIKLAINGYTLAQYYYDAENRRVRKTVWSGMQSSDTHYCYDGWRAIEERIGGTPTRQYVFGVYLDEPLCMDVNDDGGSSCIGAGDTRYYYHQNAIYSVVAITNEDGEIVEAYEYDPYGKHILLTDGDADGVVEFDGSDNRTIMGASQENIGNPWTFKGQRFDPEAGLHYYKNRYYSCAMGRFISRDPLGGRHVQYEYSTGDPITCLDPIGFSGIPLPIGPYPGEPPGASGVGGPFHPRYLNITPAGDVMVILHYQDEKILAKNRQIECAKDICEEYGFYTLEAGSIARLREIANSFDLAGIFVFAHGTPMSTGGLNWDELSNILGNDEHNVLVLNSCNSASMLDHPDAGCY